MCPQWLVALIFLLLPKVPVLFTWQAAYSVIFWQALVHNYKFWCKCVSANASCKRYLERAHYDFSLLQFRLNTSRNVTEFMFSCIFLCVLHKPYIMCILYECCVETMEIMEWGNLQRDRERERERERENEEEKGHFWKVESITMQCPLHNARVGNSHVDVRRFEPHRH